MKLAVEIALLLTIFACGSLVAWCVLALRSAARRETRNTQERHDAMQRHPAGERLPANGCEGWTPPAVRFEFRARPCGHLLFCHSLDGIDMEHAEFDHVLQCWVATQILSERDAA